MNSKATCMGVGLGVRKGQKDNLCYLHVRSCSNLICLPLSFFLPHFLNRQITYSPHLVEINQVHSLPIPSIFFSRASRLATLSTHVNTTTPFNFLSLNNFPRLLASRLSAVQTPATAHTTSPQRLESPANFQFCAGGRCCMR